MGEPRFDKPAKKAESKPEAISLEEFDVLANEAFTEAREQMEIVGPSLREIMERVVREKPNMLIFLDKGARIFGSPVKKYLSERMSGQAPEVAFYNDNELKGEHLFGDIDQVTRRDFEKAKGQKVFFIDETFSQGVGADAVLEASNRAGIDSYYFALSRDPEPHKEFTDGNMDAVQITRPELESRLAHDAKAGRLVIYEHSIHSLFSRMASRMYVNELDGQTVSPHREHIPNVHGIPSALDYLEFPNGMTKEQYREEMSKRTMRAVAKIKDLIYQSLTV